MRKTQSLLTGLLGVQLAVTVALLWNNYNVEQQGQPELLLAGFEPDHFSQIQIADGEQQLVLQKTDRGWVLPALSELPVHESQLNILLEKLEALKAGWPVATTDSAHERFEVSAEKFQRQLIFTPKEGQPITLYLGTAPGFRKTHVRAEGQQAVYAAVVNTYEWSAKAEEWLDKQLLSVKSPKTITGPDYSLKKNEQNEWVFANDPEAEQKLNTAEAQKLATALQTLRVLNKADKNLAEVQKDAQAMALSVTSNQGDRQFQLFHKDDQYWVVRDDINALFVLSKADYERLAQVRLPQLVLQESAETESNEPTGSKPMASTVGVAQSASTQ